VAILAGSVANFVLDGPGTVRAALALPVRAWLLVAYLTIVCSVIGYALWYVVIQDTEVNVASLTVFLQPVVGVLVAMATLGETLRWGQLWGSLVIVAGLVIGLSRQIRPAAATRN
jgi:drug/metabolite transporter (DMT)-like permease